MPSTETLEVAVTTRIAVVDAVASAPVALPSSTEYCSITHRIDNNVCTGDIVGLMILLVGFFIGPIMNMAICFKESEKDVKDLIGWLKSRPKKEWEEIIDSRAEALGASFQEKEEIIAFHLYVMHFVEDSDDMR
ncbi:hypothetical protein BOTNAR_2814g00010 [Botryotinia narcissicola]|uniref:Uncharacterized protein n=1 Tax=Botryotinia narcissicola TaxID=278944 RepID=A0A4Z1H2U6_9HELO|nr:hypothetical protein BOTNAR_2814g00010 [Botryotinia narcissicola]